MSIVDTDKRKEYKKPITRKTKSNATARLSFKYIFVYQIIYLVTVDVKKAKQAIRLFIC